MTKPYWVILLASMAITAFLYWLDSDPPTDALTTTLFVCALYTAFFFSFISGIYYAVTSMPMIRRKA